MLRVLLLALAPSLHAITIKIDYTYDSSNFFNTPAKKAAMEAVAEFYGNLISDSLLRINPADFPGSSWIARPTNPSTGVSVEIPGLVVPEDTIIVYVGARILSGSTLGTGGPSGWSAGGSSAWFNRIRGRGNPGAESSTASLRTDFALWGGSITFDSDRTWNFSLTTNQTGTEFVTVALHEMGHVLGVGTASSWNNKISGSSFTGAASTRSNGTPPPIQSGGGHFDSTVPSRPVFGSFGRTHGVSRPVLMRPSFSDTGLNFDVAGDLDLAALIDIGWQIHPPTEVATTGPTPASAAFSWNSSSFFNYRLQRSTTLASFPGGSGLIEGNGNIQMWSDPLPPTGSAFYRLARTPVFNPPAAAAMAQAQRFQADSYSTDSEEPRMIECNH